MVQLRVRGLFGQRNGGPFSEVNVLNEANFHRCHLVKRMDKKAVECCRDEDDDNKEVQPSVQFMSERRDREKDEGAEASQGSVNYDSK